MRKLILKDSDGWLTEVDFKAFRREALMLKAYIEKASCGEENLLNFRQELIPLVESALNGTLTIPFKGGAYSICWMMEGLKPWLPEPLGGAYFTFMGCYQRHSPYLSTLLSQNPRYQGLHPRNCRERRESLRVG
jgi:hypothetical protein